MSRYVVLEKISKKADELARQYNKTKDPGLKSQWYKLIKQVPPEPLAPLLSRR